MNGGRISVVQVAADAFGNALGESLAQKSSDPLGDFINANAAKWNISVGGGVIPVNAGQANNAQSGMTFSQDKASRQTSNYWSPTPSSIDNSSSSNADLENLHSQNMARLMGQADAELSSGVQPPAMAPVNTPSSSYSGGVGSNMPNAASSLPYANNTSLTGIDNLDGTTTWDTGAVSSAVLTPQVEVRPLDNPSLGMPPPPAGYYYQKGATDEVPQLRALPSQSSLANLPSVRWLSNAAAPQQYEQSLNASGPSFRASDSIADAQKTYEAQRFLGTMDALASSPFAAITYLAGKASGASPDTLAGLAIVGAAGGDVLTALAGAKSSRTGAANSSVDSYVSGLYKLETPTSKASGLFEVEQTGPYNYRVPAGNTTIDIDGYKGTTMLDAKFVEKPAVSPYINDSSAPSFLREKILKEQQWEFQRYKAAIDDPAVPFNRLDVLTNEPKAVPYFRSLMDQYSVPGTVKVVSTQIPQKISGSQ